jgi:integrase
VKDLTPADVRGFVRDVIAGKTAADVRTKARGRARVTGGPGTAARTTGLLSGILTYAVQEGYRENNPVNGVRRPADGKRKARLDDEGYRKLGEILRQAEAEGESWQAVEAIRFAALTGCRRGEVQALRRAELDFPGRALRLSDTKTGESIRPMSAIAADRAALALARHGGAFVFPSDRKAGAHYRGLAKAWTRIVGDALPGITLHVLRHSFTSTAEDLGYSLPTIGALLGHAGAGVTSRYVHKLDAALVAAADRVSRHIADAMGEAPTADVVELHPRARASA